MRCFLLSIGHTPGMKCTTDIHICNLKDHSFWVINLKERHLTMFTEQVSNEELRALQISNASTLNLALTPVLGIVPCLKIEISLPISQSVIFRPVEIFTINVRNKECN